ncbi:MULTISPECIES: DUF3953 domain-containing protein [Bacillus]|uniref:DUF3953 domain-containing protein n=1 Tax=Bacillus pseudomycoides TaxID=64104 RepID=A0AAJ2DI49_9BACI|nr:MULTISPECIES: DUF3953 domain-containing protein [Bacillus cereus group]MBD5800493.1 hypothetical protein [Bacillus pseudomycoides]MBJ8028055.1 DUF3953 domain-containing protein [Bacillus cereus group sp. N21]MCR8857473.1 DUF3953 domain-containing protein [Bacillus pseudomycoides]MDR4189142.1 DUF3953 domain-containing protein [Bacillus pseudomycoides]MDR4325119.1 DUF3953 domain-containing protein [Bacillus pseudomycoides]
MLTGLRIFFVLLTLVLLGYYYFTKTDVLPYMQLSLACMFIIMGISEMKARRKTLGIASFLVSGFIFFIVISILLR